VSNALAVATVSAALGRIIHGAARSAVPGAEFFTGRPAEDGGPLRVHLYLYQVMPNAALRNDDLPTRGADGVATRRPSAALDLHYLIAFYGDQANLEPERMLGAVVRDLHAHPVLTRDDIAAVIAGAGPLSASDLADAVERVRFTPLTLGLEELAKLWSIFFQTRHAVSVAYQASVVTIETDARYRPTFPVLMRGEADQGVTVFPGPFTILAEVRSGEAGDQLQYPRPPAYPAPQLGRTLFITGQRLTEVQSLRFVHSRLPLTLDLAVPPAGRSAEELMVALPDDGPAQTGYAAGLYGVRAILPPVGGLEQTTNVLPLPLAPRIAALGPAMPMVRDPAGNATVTVTCHPRVWPTQRATLMVAGREILAEPRSDSDPPTETLTFRIASAPRVNQALVQLRVDGVDSIPLRRRGLPPVLAFDDTQRITIT
jgi:hypothetical protein